MILKKIPFALALTLAAAFIVSCGPENNLSKEDVAYVKRKRLQEQFGTNTVTQTNTSQWTVTAFNSGTGG